jgi:ribosomal RNA-processing protein 36
MAISDSLNKRLRARRDEEEDEFEDEILSDEMEDIEEDAGSNSDEEEDSNSDAKDSEEDDGDEDEDISDTQSIQSANDRDAIQSEFRQISFGALAKAQNSIGKKRKQGAEDDKSENQTDDKKPSSTLEDIRERLRKARERKLGLTTNTNNDNNNETNNRYNSKPKPPPRTSKHAPAIQSSKVAVSRKRTIIEPTTTKSRDPRFDPTVVKSSTSARGSNNSGSDKAYAFLDEYRASEIKQLKEQFAKTKDVSQKEELKRAITSATDRQRTLDNRKREREVLQEHKKKEKQLIKEGKKTQPYFLKKSELKREVLKKKYESMGSKERAKALERKRKKVASKEKKDLPWARRGMEN